MIGYTSIGTNDLPRAVAFYDTLFELLGHKRMMEFDDFVVWGSMVEKTANFSVHIPEDSQQATIGNGVMIALQARNKKEVMAAHSLVLSLGGSNEGDPGPRGDGDFFAAYVRDLDGNKLNFHCFDQDR